MSHPTRRARLDGVFNRIAAAGPVGAETREVTPAQGGIRRRDVEALIEMGLVEWVEKDRRARVKACASS